MKNLKSQILKQISQPRKASLEEGLVKGMYLIIRHLSSYRVEHFLKDDFYASQFFALLSLIDEELREQNKQYKKLMKSNKK